MLRVKILGADGSYVTRDEIVSLYASDMDYVPYIRKASVDYDATVNLEVPQGPVILHAKLRVPGYGYGRVEDTGYGFSDTGYWLDLWLPTVNDCRIWGRKYLKVYVLG